MTFEISRYRVHRAKIEYWKDRLKMAKLNEMAKEIEQRYGSREEADSHADYNRVVTYRKTLIGRLKGIEDIFKVFDISLEKDAAPVVNDEDILGEVKS